MPAATRQDTRRPAQRLLTWHVRAGTLIAQRFRGCAPPFGVHRAAAVHGAARPRDLKPAGPLGWSWGGGSTAV